MEKRTIPIIALAIFSISLLTGFDFIVKPVFAQNVTSSDINFATANNQVFAMESNDIFVTTSTNDRLSWIRSDIVVSAGSPQSILIEPQIGGCNAIDNPCGSNSGGLEIFGNIEPANNASWTGDSRGLWCGLTDCFTIFDTTTGLSFPNQLHRYTFDDNTFVLSGYLNMSNQAVADIRNGMGGFDSATGGIGGITLFTATHVGTNTCINRVGGTSLMGIVNTHCISDAGNALVVNAISACHHSIHPDCPANGRTAFVFGTGSASNFRTIDASMATVCTSAGFGASSSSGLTVYNEVTNTWFTTWNDNIVYETAMDSCTRTAQLSALTNFITGLTLDTDAGLYYVYHGSSSALPSINQYSLTTNAPVNFDSNLGASFNGWVSGNPAPIQTVAIDTDHKSLILTGDTSTVRIVYLTAFSPTPTPSTTGINCSLPENANILICRLGGTGAFGSAGNFIIGEAPTNTTDGTGLTGIGCAIGLVDCISDPDPQTNGLGILIFIASIFIVVGMFVTTQGMQNTIHLPIYLWAIIIIGLSAFFTITQIIDPVFLIISIIGLIALGAPKLVGMFRGSNSFGSGSTE